MSPFWQGLIEGAAAAWPPAAGGMFLTWYLAKNKVQQVTDKQNKFLTTLTRNQTAELQGREQAEPPADPDRYA